jgi:hypothetical protein
MPSSTRNWAIRELERAENLCDNIGKHVAGVAGTYEGAHTEISAPLDAILKLTLVIQNGIMEIRSKL